MSSSGLNAPIIMVLDLLSKVVAGFYVFVYLFSFLWFGFVDFLSAALDVFVLIALIFCVASGVVSRRFIFLVSGVFFLLLGFLAKFISIYFVGWSARSGSYQWSESDIIVSMIVLYCLARFVASIRSARFH